MRKGLLDLLAETAGMKYLSDLRYATPEIVAPAVSSMAKEPYTAEEWKEAFRYLLRREASQDSVDGVVAELLGSLR